MAGRSASSTFSARRVQPPAWERDRPHLTGAALRESAGDVNAGNGAPDLSALPVGTQEELICEDILFALLGLETTFLVHTVNDVGAVEYRADTPTVLEADAQLAPLAARVLQLANDHVVVREYVESARMARDAGGFVRQAVGVAVAELLGEYRLFVLRLEEALRAGRLSLQRLVYHVQPSARSMRLLRGVADAVAARRGGAALDAVYRLASGFVGADDLRDVLGFVVDRAAAPVLAMVDAWAGAGRIDDPFAEFFVREDPQYARAPAASSASFWHHRYSVDADNLPEFLAPFVESVLRAGKYLNVLRECGVDTAPKLAQVMRDERAGAGPGAQAPPHALPEPDADGITRLRLSGRELLGPDAARRIGAMVAHYFTASSRALMGYLRDEVKIAARLRSLRRYFLLEQGDFLVHFFDAAHAELVKERAKVSRTRLASLLELSVRTSVSAADPYHDDLACRLHDDDVASQMLAITGGGGAGGGGGGGGAAAARAVDPLAARKATALTGYDAFSLNYRLRWPMNLIVSDIEVLKYQLISRYLLHCKRVERELEGCWRNHAQVKGDKRALRPHFVRSFALRNRMLQFVRTMLYYTLADVLEPNWRTLSAAVAGAATLDEIIQAHGGFLDASLRECLVSNDKHLQVFYAITQVCLLFAGYTERFCRALVPGIPAEETSRNMQKHNYQVTVAKFETKFDTNLRSLMDGLSAMSKKRASSHLANLCECLDVGGFYERSAVLASAAYGV